MPMNETWDLVYGVSYYKNTETNNLYDYTVYKIEDLLGYGFMDGTWRRVDFWPSWRLKQITKKEAFTLCL